MRTPELKPCPFCGGKADIKEAFPESYIVYCVICECMFARFFKDEETARSEWNKRERDGNA